MSSLARDSIVAATALPDSWLCNVTSVCIFRSRRLQPICSDADERMFLYSADFEATGSVGENIIRRGNNGGRRNGHIHQLHQSGGHRCSGPGHRAGACTDARGTSRVRRRRRLRRAPVGTGSDEAPAHAVATQLVAAGGRAVASTPQRPNDTRRAVAAAEGRSMHMATECKPRRTHRGRVNGCSRVESSVRLNRSSGRLRIQRTDVHLAVDPDRPQSWRAAE